MSATEEKEDATTAPQPERDDWDVACEVANGVAYRWLVGLADEVKARISTYDTEALDACLREAVMEALKDRAP